MSEDRLASGMSFQHHGRYLDCAYTHPISVEAGDAVREYLRVRQGEQRESAAIVSTSRDAAIGAFSRLHHCEPASLALIPSTMAGENIVVRGLGIAPGRGRVVTDGYHFNGSLFMYDELHKSGVDVHIVMPREHRLELADFDAAITADTTLVAVSAVSATSGFVHDLKALCELAHSRGALVYADIVQAAGAMPLDLEATGVDFCACSTYKWLMGDFGIGFFYARPESAARLIRNQVGYRQMAAFGTHFLPYDTPAPVDGWPLTSESAQTLAARVEVGTQAHAAIVALGRSLPLLEALGLDTLQGLRRPLLARLAQALPGMGFEPMTAADTPGPIAVYACRDTTRLRDPLAARAIRISLYPNRIRISPSMFNTMDDIEALIEALK